MDWSKIPDILAIASLACAFASILRHNRTPAHRLWLVGWSMIVLHFLGFMVIGLPGIIGTLGAMVGLIMLVGAIVGGICGANIVRRAPAGAIRIGTLVLSVGITLVFFARAYLK